MDIKKKITNLFKSQEVDTKKKSIEYGGFEILKRMTSGKWSKTKMLEQYESSLYVYACVYKIAEKVASTDFDLFQIMNSQGETKEIMNHEALDLLHRVNPFQTKSEFLKITMINKKLSGDAFWYKVRGNNGKVMELWNLRPDRMEIVKSESNFIKGYVLNKTDGTREYFAPEDIVHFKYPTPLDQYFGIGPVKPAQVRISTETSASEYQRDFFLNNARPDAAIKTSQMLTDQQKQQIREDFGKRHQGRGNNSKLAIFESGLEYQQLSMTQREMDYIESMKFTRDDILVAFGVPKAIVSITDDVNRANAETSMYIFLSETIKPELEMLCEKINEELIMPDFGDNLFLDYKDPTPENREQTLLEYESGLKNGYLLINEVRDKENMQPIKGGWELYKPLNEQPVGGTEAKDLGKTWKEREEEKEKAKREKLFVGKPMLKMKLELKEKMLEALKKQFAPKTNKEKAKTMKSKTKKELTALINTSMREDYAKMVIKQIDTRADTMKSKMTELARTQGEELLDIINLSADLKKGTKKTKTIGPKTNKAIEEFFKAQEPVFTSFSFPFIEEFVRNAGLEAMMLVDPNVNFVMTERIMKTIKKRAEEFGLGINKTTRSKVTLAINTGLTEGEGMTAISDRISKVYEEFPTWRSDLIARTESTAGNNEGFMEAYRQSEVTTHKEWIAVMDSRTRPEHQLLDGEIVPVGKSFSNGLMYPQEPGCRCVLGPAFEK